MDEAQRLWEKYSEDMPTNYPNNVITQNSLKELLSDYSPWISDREPTVEDGGMDGMVLVQVPYYTREG